MKFMNILILGVDGQKGEAGNQGATGIQGPIGPKGLNGRLFFQILFVYYSRVIIVTKKKIYIKHLKAYQKQ